MTRIDLAIAERTLPSGLTLIAVRNPGVPTFAGGVTLDVDLRHERAGEAGLANLVGDCLDEGTQHHDNLELASALDSLGASLDGNASGATVHCPAENAAKAIALLAEVVQQPAFPAREVKRVKNEVLAEIKAEEDDPRAVASQRFRSKVYGAHPFGRSVRGTARTLAGITRADLTRFHRRTFGPARGYAAAAGPDEPERTLALLEKHFKRWDRSTTERPETRTPTLQAQRTEEHVPMPREQTHVFVGHIGISRFDPDYHALSVMDHILGTGPGFTSRIARTLRDEQGLCYAVDAGITASAGEEPGTFTAYIGTSPEHRQRAIDGFLAEMRRLRQEPPRAPELEDVQQYLTGSFVWQLERNLGLVRYALRAKRFGLGYDYLHRYPGLIRAVTRDEVVRVAAQHLHPDHVTIVSAGASARAARATRHNGTSG